MTCQSCFSCCKHLQGWTLAESESTAKPKRYSGIPESERDGFASASVQPINNHQVMGGGSRVFEQKIMESNPSESKTEALFYYLKE